MSNNPDLFPRGSHRRGKGGIRDDLGIYVRSSWEANWARYLNWLQSVGEIQSWEYEPHVFEFTKIRKGSRFYTPDFRIVNKNGSIEYHEVKGYMDQRSSTKLKRMKLYYPRVKLVLVDKAVYMGVKQTVRPLIPLWE